MAGSREVSPLRKMSDLTLEISADRDEAQENENSVASPLASDDEITERNEGQELENDEAPVASDNESVSSDDSEVTEMEPFADYLPKIEQLLVDIGMEHLTAEVIHHGLTYQNCVYALTSPDPSVHEYILRVPILPDFRESDGRCVDIQDDAALLGHLDGKMPVPKTRAYSTICENPLNAPFTVQTLLPGTSLDDVYWDLAHEERTRIIDQFVELLAEHESITFPTAGKFTAPASLPASTNAYDSAEPVSVSIFAKGDEEFVKDPQMKADRQGPNLKSFLVSHIKGWIEKETRVDADGKWPSLTLQSWKRVLEIVDELDREGAFKHSPYPVVLHHFDLEPRNIMVDKVADSWNITGVIDWDHTDALPRPLSRRPPDWIWELNGGPAFTGYLDNDHFPNPDISEEGLALKSYFDDKAAAALPDYLEDAYETGRWLRRIWTFAEKGAESCWYMDLIKQLVKDWDERTVTRKERPDQTP